MLSDPMPAPGTTNADAPFQPGEIVEFCDERYLVLRNHGATGGRVQCWPNDEDASDFWVYWTFEGEPCRRTGERINL